VPRVIQGGSEREIWEGVLGGSPGREFWEEILGEKFL